MYHLGKECQSFGSLYTMDRQRRKTLCIAVREEPKGRKAHHAGGRIPVSLRIAIGRPGRDLGKEGFGSIFLCAVCGNGTQKTLSCALGRKADSETSHKEKKASFGITELEYSELTYCFENRKIRKILLTPLYGGDILSNVAARDKRSCEDTGFPWSLETAETVNS